MSMAENRPPESRPASAVSVAVGLSGLAGLFIAVLIARNFGAVAAALGFPGLPARADGPYAALVCVLLCGLPMVCWSLFVDKVHRRASTGIDWSLKRPVSDVLDDSIVKITGLWVTWGLIAAIYGLFRFWWNNQYANFPFSMKMFEAAAIPLVLVSVPYVVWLDRYLINIRDGAWHLGAWVAGPRRLGCGRDFPPFARLGGEGLFPGVHDFDCAGAVRRYRKDGLGQGSGFARQPDPCAYLFDVSDRCAYRDRRLSADDEAA